MVLADEVTLPLGGEDAVEDDDFELLVDVVIWLVDFDRDDDELCEMLICDDDDTVLLLLEDETL